MSEQWLRERLNDAVAPAPPGRDRLQDLVARRNRQQRHRAAGAVLATCLAVVTVVLGTQHLGHDRGTPAQRPDLACPTTSSDDRPGPEGATRLARGAVAARLCSDGNGAQYMRTPMDTLHSGLNQLIDTVNDAPVSNPCGAFGPPEPRYRLRFGYPDGTSREVELDFSGCGSIVLGSTSRRDPQTVLNAYVRLLEIQRKHSTPPSSVSEPKCLGQYSNVFPTGTPDEMVRARLCVSYNDGKATSVPVPGGDLARILRGWRDGARTPEEKGQPCGPTTPTWVLSGVTAWGDQTQITAECDRPLNGNDWVTLPSDARAAVNGLIHQAGVHVVTVDEAKNPWWLAVEWVDDINARATVSHDKTAAERIAKAANQMWVADPQLPDGPLDWNVFNSAPAHAPGWRYAHRVPARLPQGGEAVFTIVRNSPTDPWKILSLTTP